jgi:MFS family permease
MVHIVPHTTDLAFSTTNAARILTIIGGVSIAGKVIWGSIVDKIGNKPAIAICFIMMFVTLIWLLFAWDLWTFYLFAIFFGIAYAGWGALMSLIIADLFGLVSLGLILGVVTFEVAFGNAFGPLLTGWIYDASGSYQLAFLVCAIFSAIAAVLALLLKPVAQS